MKQDKIHWGRVLRRGAALFMATITAWVILITAGTGAAVDVFQSLGEDPDFITSALQAELGGKPGGDGPLDTLDGWQRLVLGQSAYLRAGEGAVAARLGQGSGPDGETLVPPSDGSTAGEAPPADGKQAGQDAENDPDDPENLPAVTTAPNDIVPRTLIPTTTDGYAYADGVFIFNRTQLSVDAPALAAASVDITLADPAQPQVLIMHTHGTEAYTQDGTDVYTPSDNSRTLDGEQNMIRVGNEIKAVFEEMGLSVLHDETLYDYPAYKEAYSRSGAAVEEYLKQYPSIKIVLDVHRDALIGEDGTVYKAVAQVDGKQVSQVMLVLGSPEGGDHPDWQKNLTLAMKIQQSMNTLYPTLARPITIRGSVYNQELTTGSLLVEVGCHGNTLEEAVGGARLFARAAGQVLLGLEEKPS